MATAHECGTDNEEYGALAYGIADNITIGINLPPIAFCPWCGDKKTTTTTN